VYLGIDSATRPEINDKASCSYLSNHHQSKLVDDTQSRLAYPRTAIRRVVYGLIGIAVVMVVGVVGFRATEGMSLVNAIYFESMLATGQGPPLTLTTDTGKLFASFMAFVSVGSVITTLFFTLAPVLGQVWREVLQKTEEEARKVESDLVAKTDKKADSSDE